VLNVSKEELQNGAFFANPIDMICSTHFELLNPFCMICSTQFELFNPFYELLNPFYGLLNVLKK
jgi:hypothetical protein